MATQRTASKQTIEHLLRLMATRMSWTLGAKVIEGTAVHVSRGWGETISNFSRAVLSPAQLDRAEKKFFDAFQWHTFVGNKQVTWYKLSALNESYQWALRQWAEEFDAGALAGRLGINWTGPTEVPHDQAALGQERGVDPVLMSAYASDGILYFQYYSVRTYSLRETINVEDLSPDDRRRLGRYFEIIGVKLVNVPCFDTVVLDTNTETFELRIDFSPGMSFDGQLSAATSVMASFNELMMAELTIQPLGLGLVNFFPAVARILPTPQQAELRHWAS